MEYVSLHTHTTFSYGDGYGLPDEHVARVAELGMKALALTEHGNVSSHVRLELAAKEHGIKPIFGIEAYVAPTDMREQQNQRKWHMTMLAMDQEGYRNLMRMVTQSWRDDFYRWATVTGKNLFAHNKGLICTSGCADSHLACTLLGGKGIPAPETAAQRRASYDAAVGVLKMYKRMLGDRYYLEVQRFPELARSCKLNVQYAKWSEEFGIPLVASSDVHYPHPDDNELQKILHAASRNTGTVAAAEAEWEYDIRMTYPQSDDEIMSSLMGTGLTRGQAQSAILNTARIAERCNVELPKMDRIRYAGTRRDLAPWPAPKLKK